VDIVERAETVQKDLDVFIERRSWKGEADADEREELWKESVRRYNARRREANRLAWVEYHRGQAERCRAVLASLVSYHEGEAERYLPEERKTA
jgi:hypothetical protein